MNTCPCIDADVNVCYCSLMMVIDVFVLQVPAHIPHMIDKHIMAEMQRM